MSPRWGQTNSGFRVLRYPIYPSSVGFDYRDADQVEFRLAEVYYTLAECRTRAGDAGGAKTLVNDVRQRYFAAADAAALEQPGPGFDSFDMDWMLSEWGLEYLDEGRRRRTDCAVSTSSPRDNGGSSDALPRPTALCLPHVTAVTNGIPCPRQP